MLRAPAAPVGARHIGTLEHPGKVLFRDGAATGLLKGQLTWLFHVTHFTGNAEDGATFRSATAAFGDTANPLAVTEPLDKQGIPFPLLSLTAEEMRADSSDGGGSTTFVWPSVMVDNGFEALVYYAKTKLSSGNLDVEYSGVGIARLKEGSTVAVRDSRLLFDASEPGFDSGGFVTGGYLYLYGCTASADHACRIARAPRGGFTDRSRFTFWDGCQWTPDVSKSSAIMEDMPAEMTVSYNAFLNKYLAVYTGTAPNEAFMRTAARPEGPWSEPVLAFRQFPHKILLVNYGAKEHPELSREGGRVIFVSYPQQLDAESNVIQLVELTLG